MNKKSQKGLSLIELLVALIVTSIVVTAVATLASALDTVNDFTQDICEKQAQIRYAAIRISDLLKYCKLICGTPDGELAVWKSDDNDDGQININELVYIERGTDNDYLRLCEFNSSYTSVVSLSDIQTLTTDGYYVSYVQLIPQCSNVQFYLDDSGSPPNSKFVSISYDIIENSITHQCQINATLRSRAGNLIVGGNIVSDDD